MIYTVKIKPHAGIILAITMVALAACTKNISATKTFYDNAPYQGPSKPGSLLQTQQAFTVLISDYDAFNRKRDVIRRGRRGDLNGHQNGQTVVLKQ